MEKIRATGLFDEELNIYEQPQYVNTPILRTMDRLKNQLAMQENALATTEESAANTQALREGEKEPPTTTSEITLDSWFDKWVGRFEGTERTVKNGVVTRAYGVQEKDHKKEIAEWYINEDVPTDAELTPEQDKDLARFIWHTKHEKLLLEDTHEGADKERHKNYASLPPEYQSLIIDAYWHGNNKYPMMTKALATWVKDKDNDELRWAVYDQARRVEKVTSEDGTKTEIPSTTFDNRVARALFTVTDLADWQNQDHVTRLKQKLKLLEFEGGAKPEGVYLDMFQWDEEDAKLFNE